MKFLQEQSSRQSQLYPPLTPPSPSPLPPNHVKQKVHHRVVNSAPALAVVEWTEEEAEVKEQDGKEQLLRINSFEPPRFLEERLNNRQLHPDVVHSETHNRGGEELVLGGGDFRHLERFNTKQTSTRHCTAEGSGTHDREGDRRGTRGTN